MADTARLPGMTSLPAITALRSATRELHARLDSAMPLAQAQPTLADYARHLRLLDAWLAALAASSACAALPRLAQAVAAQRQLIGQDFAGGELRALAPPCALPPLTLAGDAQAAAWGVLYVVEGSRLGAAVLHARLKDRFAHALIFLREGGEGDIPWPRTMAQIDEALTAPEALSQACTAARAAFELLLRTVVPAQAAA